MTFNTIRAFSIRPGDKLPAPLSWGGWDYSKAVPVQAVRDDGEMKVFALETGETVRAFPMGKVPFIRR